MRAMVLYFSITTYPLHPSVKAMTNLFTIIASKFVNSISCITVHNANDACRNPDEYKLEIRLKAHIICNAFLNGNEYNCGILDIGYVVYF